MTCSGCQFEFAVADRREHKEQIQIDNLTTPKPSWHCQNFVLTCLPAREPPQKLRGLGEFLDGVKGKISPCRFGQRSRFFHASASFGGRRIALGRAHILARNTTVPSANIRVRSLIGTFHFPISSFSSKMEGIIWGCFFSWGKLFFGSAESKRRLIYGGSVSTI